MTLRDKVVLITGAANGIGLCLTNLFAAEGATLVLVDKDKEGLDKLGTVLNSKYDCPITAIAGDLSSEDVVLALLETMEICDIDTPDIIVNNAGVGHHGELSDTSMHKWAELLTVNLLSPIVLVDAFLKDMIKRGSGHIVNVSSGQAFFRLPTWGAYSVVKLALGAWSELLGVELEKYGINVTTVYPFMVETGFYKGVVGETWAARLSMKLLPYYSMSAENVAKKIFDATMNKKSIEMVNPINYAGQAMRALPPVAALISKLVNKLMSK